MSEWLPKTKNDSQGMQLLLQAIIIKRHLFCFDEDYPIIKNTNKKK